MGNKKKQKETITATPAKYKCSICGGEHEKESLCPIVTDKLNKLEQQKKKNFLWGNIFLECLEQDRNIYDLLYEIAYIQEMSSFGIGNRFNKRIYGDTVINYCAMELNCNPKKFIVPPEKTIEKLVDLGYFSYDYISENENNEIEKIYFKVDVSIPKAKYTYTSWGCQDFNIYATKERKFDSSWCYCLYLECPDIVINGMDQVLHKYFISNDTGCSTDIFLAEDYNGRLAQEIEREIDTYWVELSESVSANDPRFDIWIKKIEKATLANELCWKNYNDFYATNYKDYEIRLDLNQEHKALGFHENDIDYIYHQFSIRFNRERAITFTLIKEKEKIEILFALAQLIKNSIKQMKTLVEQPILKEKIIEFADVLVISSSMYCKTKGHEIIPYRGIVNILTEDNIEKEYYIYVGYCKECGTYTVFDLDYKKMLEKGKPLCTVYKYDDAPTEKLPTKFAYKSQSILAVKGYNVQAGNDLSETERQNILKDCIDKNLVQIHDLLNFLNWLIKTREPLPKYKNAISKWKKDIVFVEEYKKEKRDSVNVNSITVKN